MGFWRVGLLVVCIFWLVVAIPPVYFGQPHPLLLWAVTALIFVLLLVGAAIGINTKWFGVLIDSRNKVSLSRLQIIAWTVMTLSAYAVIATCRLVNALSSQPADWPAVRLPDAINIIFQQELVIAMGISAASFAGSALIKSGKKSRQIAITGRLSPDAIRSERDKAKADLALLNLQFDQKTQDKADATDELTSAKALPAADPTRDDAIARADIKVKNLEKELPEIEKKVKEKSIDLDHKDKDLTAAQEAEGLLHKNADASEARLLDLFRGEEIANFRLLDISKVQMLFFTIVVIAVYAAQVAAMIVQPGILYAANSFTFPEFSDTMNGLLGVSHAAYLSVKAVDQTSSTQ